MKNNPQLWLLLILFALTAGYFSIRVPAFETPDEFQHYAFVQHLVTWYDLPQSEPDTPGLWRQQGVQAPLYYMGGALLTFWIDQSEFPQTAYRVNYFARLGQTQAQDNRNFFLPHADDGWPWRKEFLALHILRFYSVCLSCVALYAIYRFVRLFLDRDRALLGVAVCAFIPQFVFISGAASNDNLVMAMVTLFLWQLAVFVQAGRETEPAERARALYPLAIRLGIVLAAALLAKLSALGLIGVAGLALGWIAWRQREARLLWTLGGRVFIPALLLAGWWFGRNVWMYGDPLAWNIWTANITLRTSPLTLGQLQAELPLLFQSFWGLFGWLTAPYPPFIYTILGGLTALVLVAFGIWLVRAIRTLDPSLYLLENTRFFQASLAWIWLGVLVISWLRFMLVATAAQGRYFFPALPALALAVGLSLSLLPAHLRKAAWIVPCALLGLTVATPHWIIDRAYTPPSVDQYATAELHPLDAVAGHDPAHPDFALLGIDIPRDFLPGTHYPVLVRLQALNPVAEDYAIFVHLRDASGNVVAQYDGMPGDGLWPTSQWPVGETRTERLVLRIPPDVPSQTAGQIFFGFYNTWTWIRPLWHDRRQPAAEPYPNELVLGSFFIHETAD